MHSAHLNDFDHVGELEPHAAFPGADQEESSMGSAQFTPMRVSSLVMRPAMSPMGST